VQRRALPPRAGHVVHHVGRAVRLRRVAGPSVANAALVLLLRSRAAVLAVNLRSVLGLAARRVRRDHGPRSQVEYLRVRGFNAAGATAAFCEHPKHVRLERDDNNDNSRENRRRV